MPAQEVELDGAVRLIARGFDAYERVFARGRAGRALSRSRPIRRAGFDLQLRLTDRAMVAEDVVALTLEDRAGRPLPSWHPGAHLDVFLPSGRLRQYSLCGDPRDRSRYRVAVRRVPDGNGGSEEIHDTLAPGAILHVRGPRNAFRLVDAPSYLFVAGGIGITPILPMLRAVVAAGDRPWRLVYTGRDRASMPFVDEITALAGPEGAERVVLWPDDVHGVPDGRRILAQAPPGAALYTCGPPAMIEAIRAVVPDPTVDTLHYERFSPAPVRGGSPFTVRLARSGSVVDVAADETALAAVLRTRPDQAYSCQQGFCGTCRVRVLAGAVDHRDTRLTPSERTTEMLLCVSRGDGELVIDA